MKKRVISAIIMALMFVPFLLLGDIWYMAFISILGILSLWELIRLEKNIPNYMQFLSYIICLLLILYRYNSLQYYNIVNYPIIISMFLIYSFSVIINDDLKKYNYKDGLWLMGVTLLIGLIFNSAIKVRMIGLYDVLYCMIIAYVTDSFALFGGMLFGKHKLCKEISPNKTIEGGIIGTLVGTILGSLFYYFVIGNEAIWLIMTLSLVLSVFGQFGDLFFSSIKRNYGIKDFSNVIPGHGGILDRLDSLLFVLLGFLLYILII